jgi:hypothetical protein
MPKPISLMPKTPPPPPPPPPPQWRPTETFLEFVAERLLGPPNYVGADGGYWYCPACGSSRFHTRPSRHGCKDKWSCWSCGKWGDEHDLLKLIYSGEDYGQRLNRLYFLRADFERLPSHRPARRPLAAGGPNGEAHTFLSGEPSPAWPSLVADSAERLWQPATELQWEGGSLRWREVPEHAALGWLRRRGLRDGTIRTARLGVSTGGNVLIPWFDAQGGVQGVNVRRFDREPRYAMLRGSRKGIPYPDYQTDDRRPVLLVEGELDTLLARQELRDLAQAVTFGGASDHPPAQIMADLARKEVIVALDGDKAGDSNSEELRKALPNARRLRPPDGLDLTDLHATVGLRCWFETLAAT